VALVDDQLILELLPLFTVLGLAPMFTVAVGFALTVTVVDWVALPPLPVHVSANVALAESAPVGCEPPTGLAPDHPPDAVQEVAFVADQASVELLPLMSELGLALKLTVGAEVFTDTVADCVAFPPAPVQVKV
jgi:hypothetical protein